MRCSRDFADYPVAVELRHRSWSDDFGATLSLLNSHNAALTQIDEPKFKLSIRQNQLPNITGFYYMRLHGRNAAQWWKHDKSEDRYNYLYSADELKTFAETADAARRLVKKFYLYFNNHFASKAVVNAVMIKKQLGRAGAWRVSEGICRAISRDRVDRFNRIDAAVRPRVSAGSAGPHLARRISGSRSAGAGANTARTAAKARCSSAGTNRIATVRSADTSTSGTTETYGGCGS